jgi:hypothetical protein
MSEAENSKSLGEAKSEQPTEKGLGGVPFLSSAIARGRVARLEKLVSKFRIRTSQSAARLSSECARTASIQAAALAAKEAAQDLGSVEREVLLRRVAEAETRMERVLPLCSLPRTESVSPSGSVSPGGELSGEKQ